MEVYVVKQAWQDSTGLRDFCVLGVFSTQEKAREVLKQERDTLISEYYNGIYLVSADRKDEFYISTDDFGKWDEITIDATKLV